MSLCPRPCKMSQKGKRTNEAIVIVFVVIVVVVVVVVSPFDCN